MSVRAVLITPLTGPLALFGRAGAVALGLWASRAGIELGVRDCAPDPAAATGQALAGDPHLVFGPYGSGPTRAVLAAAGGRLVFNHGGSAADGGADIPVLAPAGAGWHGALRLAADAGLRSVRVAHGGTGFGRTVGDGAAAEARRLGLTVSTGDLDGPAPADGDVLLTAGRFEQEQAAAAAWLPGPWRLTGMCGAGTEEVLAGLGAAREGLVGPAQWVAATAPPPDLGPDAASFTAAYRAVSGTDPPYPAAQAYAAGLIAARCLAEAGGPVDGGVGDAGLRAAAHALDVTTLFGRFRLDADGRQVGHRTVTVQWQDGVRRVLWPPEQAEASLRLP